MYAGMHLQRFAFMDIPSTYSLDTSAHLIGLVMYIYANDLKSSCQSGESDLQSPWFQVRHFTCNQQTSNATELLIRIIVTFNRINYTMYMQHNRVSHCQVNITVLCFDVACRS